MSDSEVHEIIHESEYGGGELNFHVEKHGPEVHVTLTYPCVDGAKTRYIVVNQESVRASDGLRLHYDYERDGFVVEQQEQVCDCDGSIIGEGDWKEVGFFASWALEKETS